MKKGPTNYRKSFKIIMVEGGGFEPPKAELTDLQSAPFGHSGTPPLFVTIIITFHSTVCKTELEWSHTFLPFGNVVQSLVYSMYMAGTITRVSMVAMPSP